MTFKFSREEIASIDPMLLRMHLRERVHHLMEHQVYSAINAGKALGEGVGRQVESILEIWEERGLPQDFPDVKWVYRLRELIRKIKAGEDACVAGIEGVCSPRPFSNPEKSVVDRLIAERRSCRQWKDEPVPAELVQKILTAGLWSPSTCNYQIARFVVIDNREDLERFANIEFGLEQVKIVVCADRRPWDDAPSSPPAKNLYLEVGAVMQNMALVAHSLGLGGCWSTFSEKQIRDLHEYYQLPEFIEVVTYLSLGWPHEEVLPPSRIRWQEAVINGWKSR